jgi:aminoglycoside/choline kinase family phosphotransferase
MSVILRSKLLKDGKRSLWLDVYTKGFRKAEFLRLFEVITRDLYSGIQLIHGDMSTYHVFFRRDGGEEKAYFIDLGNPKFAPVVFDVGDLLFSPGIYLPLERKLEISDEYVTKDKNVTSRNFLYRAAKDILLNERKRLCFAGIFECLRRTARDREAKVKHPKHSGIFARKHPDYINPAQHYADMSRELFDFLIRNKLFCNLFYI